jgi:hypothetical protein
MVVFEFHHQRMPFQRLLNDAALDALAAAVNQPHHAKPRSVSFVQVFLDDRWDVAWSEGVKVEFRFDRDLMRLVVRCLHFSLRAGLHPHALSLGGPPAADFTPSPRSGRGRSRIPR